MNGTYSPSLSLIPVSVMSFRYALPNSGTGERLGDINIHRIVKPGEWMTSFRK